MHLAPRAFPCLPPSLPGLSYDPHFVKGGARSQSPCSQDPACHAPNPPRAATHQQSRCVDIHRLNNSKHLPCPTGRDPGPVGRAARSKRPPWALRTGAPGRGVPTPDVLVRPATPGRQTEALFYESGKLAGLLLGVAQCSGRDQRLGDWPLGLASSSALAPDPGWASSGSQMRWQGERRPQRAQVESPQPKELHPSPGIPLETRTPCCCLQWGFCS